MVESMIPPLVPMVPTYGGVPTLRPRRAWQESAQRGHFGAVFAPSLVGDQPYRTKSRMIAAAGAASRIIVS